MTLTHQSRDQIVCRLYSMSYPWNLSLKNLENSDLFFLSGSSRPDPNGINRFHLARKSNDFMKQGLPAFV